MKRKISILIGFLVTAAIILSIILINSNKNKQPDLMFISSTPQNNEQFILSGTEIVINANRNITEEDNKNLEIKITPEIENKIVYQENKIRISPETDFQIDTLYEIQILYNGEAIYSLSFTSFPITQDKLIEDGAKQAEADLAFNESYEKFLNDYPWYTQLPIEKTEYRVVYDFEKSLFRIRLKKEQTDQTKIKEITQNALEDIKKIGVKDPIKYEALQPEE